MGFLTHPSRVQRLAALSIGCLVLAGSPNFVDAQDEKSSSDSREVAQVNGKLKSAIELGTIRIELKPMVPTETVRGIRWSPKGNKIQLKTDNDVLRGKLEIGKHQPIQLEFSFESPAGEEDPAAILKLDRDGDGQFADNEVSKIEASESRGKLWYSSKATLNLPVDDGSTRPYPISLWHVVDPSEEAADNVIRWSRSGWHEGQFKINDRTCTAVITDADSDGLFTNRDAWGLGTTSAEAYSHENSANKIDSHAWLDSVPFQISECDVQGRFITIAAFDLGRTQAEDREQKDPYAPDRKYARSNNPVVFLEDLDEAISLAQKDNKRIVVDFVTTWCGPCRVMDQLVYTAQPVVEKSSELVFVKLDGDEQKALNDKFEVKGYPTLILLDPDGKELKRAVGYQSVKKMLELIK